jgi:hypothetical protein
MVKKNSPDVTVGRKVEGNKRKVCPPYFEITVAKTNQWSLGVGLIRKVLFACWYSSYI